MSYTAFDVTKPVTTPDTRQASIDSIRTNLAALRDDLVGSGMVQGFNYAVTGGTASQPGTLWYKRSAEVVKIVLTWGTSGGEDGNVTKAAFYYASNESHASFPASTNGTYSSMVDGSGNYVCTVAYDSSGNVTTTTWGSTP